MKHLNKTHWMLLGGILLLVLVFSLHNNAVQSDEAMASQSMKRTVVIDPGHGGEDGGATGVNGARESELNLAVSLKLREILRLFGCEPVMIRQTDTAVYSQGAATISEKKVSDIHNRVAQINNTPNALLVSIHQNFFTESKYTGAQVFYADNSESRALAESLQAMLRQTLDQNNRREAKPAASSIYLMNHIRCLGILVECGFLSNAAEEAKLQTPGYQIQLAAVVAAAVLQTMEAEHEV